MIINQTAPPAEAPSGDFLKLPAFPKSDTLVLTVVAFSFNPKAEFKRKDDTGNEYTEVRPGLDFFFGTMVGGKSYFCKPWTVAYSLHEKANYARWYEAATGQKAAPGTNPSDMLGKFILGAVKVENKTGKKGTAYTISKLTTVSAVPSILANTGTPLEALLPELNKILAGDGDAGKPAGSGNPY